MRNRNWSENSKRALRNLKHVFVATTIVPIYFLLMNPNYSQEGYWKDLANSTRVGFQIAFIYWLCMSGVYSFLFYKNPALVEESKKSVKFQMVTGIPLMALGLWISAILEPRISGAKFDLQSWTVGMLIGGITFSLSIFYFGYKRAVENNLKLKVESAVSNLNVLKNQMQPHFLFNSLNSLSELIESNNGEAAVMVQKLSDLYRQILENSKSPLSTLGSELKIIERYLELEKLRFGDRLSYKVFAPKHSDEIFIPSLALQTLVENAIKHGITQSVEGGEVTIKIEKENTGYQVEIANPGLLKVKKNENSGTGIENTRSRLTLLYGKDHNFKLTSDKDKTTASFWFHGMQNAN